MGVSLLHLDLKSECLVLSGDEMIIIDTHVSIMLSAGRNPLWKNKGLQGEEEGEACFKATLYES